jgi:ABC-type sugar transport system ATPase subunit
MNFILELNGVSRSFPGVQALDDVSFEVEPGTVHAIVGENGAGKSTLIKILSGTLAPDRGEIRYNGEPYRPRNPKEAIQAGITTIYQELNLLDYRSVVENVTLGQEPSHWGFVDFDAMRAQVSQVFSLLKAEQLPLDRPLETLKVSEKQIVEISKALINRSRCLIMDEPTAPLNAEEAEALFDIIETLKSQGVTIVYVSHRLNEIFRLADTITVLRDGHHIRTSPRVDTNQDQLITDMIGRKLAGVFPQRNRQLGEVVLSVEGLTRAKAFYDVSLSLHAGEILALTGVSGSGKTELGKALFGDWPVDSGSICLEEKPVRMSPARAVKFGMGYVAEDRKTEGVIQDLSVRRNLTLPVLARVANRIGLLQDKLEDQIAGHQIESLAIKTPSLRQTLGNLSGGNQQKVSLGKWLASEARIFILLEPTQGIDVAVKFEFYNLINRLSLDGVAFILISSEIGEILGLAHRILVMRDGLVVADLDGEQTNSEEILRYAMGNLEAHSEQN